LEMGATIRIGVDMVEIDRLARLVAASPAFA
jgi:phosphopantetheinyl transferase (holo-ACP synthase)